ncbi:hypothetical protein KEM60_01725 [Austwickia sp. TVS 96-490-7B]|uniref:hypothetical protein n=1 Tax=Austwickia sp. TVS 96-490-7B TaxID=2830843 RepID=UPI001C55A41F|nr:hypothetical protein [Austwickia sp. TVS 96-490-7B]MBW3085525.1 hypothetical protein [Austwickia sp. TVS 96-490-7B]
MLGLLATAAGKVLMVSIVVGAGLPALFAAGVRAMAYGVGDEAEVGHGSPHPIGKILGIAIFAVVLFAICSGIAIVVASGLGMQVSFEYVIPTFIPKTK